jgi:hypothetical protein
MELPFQLPRKLGRFKRDCLRLWGAPSGSRFESYYRRVRRQNRHDERAPRAARLAAAFVLSGLGLCLIFLPLVYIPFFVASAALVASESRRIARSLDSAESGVRRAWAGIALRYDFPPGAASLAAAAVTIACLVLTAYVWYRRFLQ